MRRTLALLAVLVLLVGGCGGGANNQSSTKPAPNSSLSYSPAVLESKTVPQSTDSSGLPAIMSPALHNAFMAQLASHLDIATEAPHKSVALFGTVVSVSQNTLVLLDQPQQVNTNGTFFPVPSDTGPGTTATDLTITVDPSSADIRMVPGGMAGLKKGLYIFVGATIDSAGALNAQMVATVAQMFKDYPKSNPAPSTPASTTALPIPQPTPPSATLTDVRTVSLPESADAPNPDTNTVVLTKTEGFPGEYEKIGPSVGFGNCSANAQMEVGIGLGEKYQWPFQLVQDDNGGFVVSALDLEPTKVYGILNNLITFSLGEIYQPQDYTIFSQWGFAIGVDIGISCSAQIGPITVSLSWSLPIPGINADFLNLSKHHIPLAGERPLTVPPTECPGVAASLGPATLGVLACETQTFSGGRFRATITGPGGIAQGIAAGFDERQQVAAATAPNGGQATINQWNYAAHQNSRLTVGLLLGLSKVPGEEGGGEEKPNSGDIFTTNQRQKNQVGPTLADGRYKTGTWSQQDSNWYNSDGSPASAPTAAEITQGYANWFHPGQKGPTYSDGSWQDQSGHWHVLNADGFFSYGPGPAAGAKANNLTTADVGDKDDEAGEIPPDIAKQVDGPTVDVGSESVSPDHFSTDALTMTVPPPAPPAPPTAAGTQVTTFNPWTPSPLTGVAGANPNFSVSYASGSCDAGSSDDPGRASAYRCTISGPPTPNDVPAGAPVATSGVGNGSPCFANTTSGGTGSPLLCSSDPTNNKVVELFQNGANIPTSMANKEDPSQPPWVIILANGLRCTFDGYSPYHDVYPYDCPGNVGVTAPDRSSPTWSVQEGSHATMQSSEAAPSGPKVAVTTAYR